MKAFTVVDTWSGSRVSGSAVCTTWSIRERRFCSEVSPGCSSSGGVNTVAHSSRSCFSTKYRAWSLKRPLAVVTRIKILVAGPTRPFIRNKCERRVQLLTIFAKHGRVVPLVIC